MVLAAAGLGVGLIVRFGVFGEPREALRYLGKELTCIDALDGPLGKLTLVSDDEGRILVAKTAGGESRLEFLGHSLMSEYYSSRSGQEIIFDGELRHHRIFGNASGYCR